MTIDSKALVIVVVEQEMATVASGWSHLRKKSKEEKKE